MDSILNKTNKYQDANMLFRPDLNQPGQKYWYWGASSAFQPGSRVDLLTSNVIKVLFCWACKTGLFLLIYRPPASAPKVTCWSSPHTLTVSLHHHHTATSPVVLTEHTDGHFCSCGCSISFLCTYTVFPSTSSFFLQVCRSHGFFPTAESWLITVMTPVGSIFGSIQQPRKAAVGRHDAVRLGAGSQTRFGLA